jgi:hypothetical protein
MLLNDMMLYSHTNPSYMTHKGDEHLSFNLSKFFLLHFLFTRTGLLSGAADLPVGCLGPARPLQAWSAGKSRTLCLRRLSFRTRIRLGDKPQWRRCGCPQVGQVTQHIGSW